MKKKNLVIVALFIIAIALSCTYPSTAQNLVPYGDFETADSIPTSTGQIVFAHKWKSSGESPDYFHTFSTVMSGVNIPNTFVGVIPGAHEGLACAGICTHMPGWGPPKSFREYLSYKLSDSLIIGKSYILKLWVLNFANPMYYGGLAADNFGIAFSNAKLKKDTDGVIHVVPLCVTQGKLYAYVWKELSFEFTADSAYKFMTIGCFVDDSTQQRQFMNAVLLFECVYTFIDEVSLVEKTIFTGIPYIEISQTPPYPNPVIDIVHLNLRNNNVRSVNVINLVGQTVIGIDVNYVRGDISLDLRQVPSGMYIMKLNTELSSIAYKLQVTH